MTESGTTYNFKINANDSSKYDADGANNFTSIVTTTVGGVRNYKLTYRNGSVDTFGSTGALIAHSDRWGNRLDLSWTETETVGTLRIVNNRTNQAMLLEHEKAVDPNYPGFTSMWKLKRITDDPANRPSGSAEPLRTVTVQYGSTGTSTGRIVAIVNASGVQRRFGYDGAGLINRVCDENNDNDATAKCTTVAYTPLATVASETLPNGESVTVDTTAATGYNLALTTKDVVGGQARVERFLRDSFGRLTRTYNPNSTTIFAQSTFDAAGQLVEVIDQVGRKSSFTYGATTGDLLTETYATGFTSAGTTSYAYNAYGQVTKTTDPMGFVIDNEYDATTGALLRMVEVNKSNTANTLVTQYEYQPVVLNSGTVSAGLITRVVFPDSSYDTYAYDLRGYPTTIAHDAGGVNLLEIHRYDWRGLHTSVTNLQGIRTDYEYLTTAGHYGSMGRPSAHINDAGGRNIRTEFTYDKVGNVIRQVEDAGSGKLNATTVATYMRAGSSGAYRASQITDAVGNVTQFDYSAHGELLSRTEVSMANRITTYSYTPEGWLRNVTLADGRVEATYGYSAAGQVTSEIDARGVRTDYSFDPRGRLQKLLSGAANVLSGNGTSTMTSVNASYSYQYDAADRLVKIFGPSSYSVTQTWSPDFRVRLQSVTNATGKSVAYAYDNRHRISTKTIGANQPSQQIVTAFSYDAMGRLTKTIQDPGAGRQNLTTTFAYTSTLAPADRFNVRRVIDARGNTKTYSYDVFGVVVDMEDAAGGIVAYERNNLGHQTLIDTPVAGSIILQPDLLGRALSRTRNGQTESWTYRLDGSIATYKDFLQRQTTYAYDGTGRLSNIDAPGVTNDVSYTYFPNDLVKTVTNKPNGVDSETITYDYDAMNRPFARNQSGRTIVYSFNPNDTLARINYWNAGFVDYTYDASRSATGINPFGVGASSYTYRSAGEIASIQRPNVAPVTNNILSNYSYDASGRTIAIAHKRAGTDIQSLSYQLDSIGNNLREQDDVVLAGTSSPASFVSTFGYNAVNRVTNASLPGYPGGAAPLTTPVSRDVAGNVLATDSTPAVLDNSERITNLGVTYDANGNMTNDGNKIYTYDETNKLIRSFDGSVTLDYQYDGNGNLVRVKGSNAAMDRQFVVDDALDSSRLLGEIPTSGRTRYHVWGPEGYHAFREVDPTTLVATTQYALLDHVSSVRSRTDQVGNPTVTFSYGVGGSLRSITGSTETYSSVGWRGQYRFNDKTLQVGNRRYIPGLGRFAQRDLSFSGETTSTYAGPSNVVSR
jgi:YD repeat-containing protein